MSKPGKSLRGQTAVVTGASSGIGRATALEFASAGATCIVHAGRNTAGADAVVQEIRDQGGNAESLLVDLAADDGAERLVEQVWNRQGEIDIWMNNAGVDVITGDAADLDFSAKLALLWQVDVRATIELGRLVGHRMKRRGSGVILNMGWDQAETGMGGDSGEMFAATKGAVMSFSRSLAKSLAPAVRVNCLAPGWIRTKWACQASEYWQDRAQRESLMNRWGTPEDVAAAALYLVSPGAGFVTGQTLVVNGGFRSGEIEK